MIPIQARVLREQRSLTQGQLAKRIKTTQTVISRLEDPNYGKLSLNSLLKLASAFDVALLVKFVSFSQLLREFEDASPQALSAKEFTEELSQLEAWPVYDTQIAVPDSQTPAIVVTTGNWDLHSDADVGGGTLPEEGQAGSDSSIQEHERSLAAARTRPQGSWTHGLARRLTIQDDTAKYLESFYGAA